MKNLIILASTLVFSLTSFAVNENDVAQSFMGQLVPNMLTQAKRGKFTGVSGAQINYYLMSAENAKGAIVISPGQTESSLKYAEVIHDLKDLGYSIYIIDHRGQGESSRLMSKPKSHVVNFSDYIDDFSKFVLEVVRPQDYKSTTILAHSMGGAIAAGFLARYPKAVTGAIFTAPMFEINPGKFGKLGALIFANILNYTGFSHNYAPGQDAYDAAEAFEKNEVTTSAARFKAKKDLYDKYPQLQVGGATVHWAKESLEYTALLRTTDNLFQIPTLLFQAGRDELVMPGAQNKLCMVKNASFCKALLFPQAKHEILMEKDSIRNVALDQIKLFLNTHSN